MTVRCETELLKTKKKVSIAEKQDLNFQTINDSTFSYELVNNKRINVSIIHSANHI